MKRLFYQIKLYDYTSEEEAKKDIEKMKEKGVGQIATLSGRFYAMDRDKRWERVEKAYNAMVLGEGNLDTSAVSAVKKSYNDDVTDEFVVPTVITDENGKDLYMFDLSFQEKNEKLYKVY